MILWLVTHLNLRTHNTEPSWDSFKHQLQLTKVLLEPKDGTVLGAVIQDNILAMVIDEASAEAITTAVGDVTSSLNGFIKPSVTAVDAWNVTIL